MGREAEVGAFCCERGAFCCERGALCCERGQTTSRRGGIGGAGIRSALRADAVRRAAGAAEWQTGMSAPLL